MQDETTDLASIKKAYMLASATPTLHLRNVPSDLDSALTEESRALGISKNRRAIEALRRGLGLDQMERSQLVGSIRQGRQPVSVDVAQLIVENRAERGRVSTPRCGAQPLSRYVPESG